MGDQIKHGFGYGFEITKDIADFAESLDLDLWDVIEDDYPLLDFNVAGCYWDHNVKPSLVTIIANTEEAYGYDTQKVGSLMNLSEEGNEQLLEFAKRFRIEVPADWFIWSYRG